MVLLDTGFQNHGFLTPWYYKTTTFKKALRLQYTNTKTVCNMLLMSSTETNGDHDSCVHIYNL
jgi:hypothetical protein